MFIAFPSLFLIAVFVITFSNGANDTQPQNGTLQSEIKDNLRVGLRTGVATASGWNAGGYSTSQVTGRGGQAGIIHNDGSYNPIYNQAVQGGQTYQTGYNPPNSYGVVTNQISPGRVEGSSYGNVDNAYRKNVYTFDSSAQSMQPLGNGQNLWVGLKPSNDSTNLNKTEPTTTTKAEPSTTTEAEPSTTKSS